MVHVTHVVTKKKVFNKFIFFLLNNKYILKYFSYLYSYLQTYVIISDVFFTK